MSRAVPEGLPNGLSDLVEQLLAVGYEIVRDEPCGPDPSFNRLTELADPRRELGRQIRLLQDRGLWEVSVALGETWHDPYDIVLALDRQEYTPRAQSHAERLRFTLEAIDRMPADDSQLAELRARLAEYREAYWRDLGVDPGANSRHPLLQRVEMAFRAYESDHDVVRLQSSLSATVAAMEGDIPQPIRSHLERLESQLDSLRFTTDGMQRAGQVDELIGRARAAIRR